MPVDLGPTSADWLDAMASPDVYQAAVRRLTAAFKESQRELDEQRQLHRREMTVLRAQLNEGLTPELLELRRSVSRWRSRAQAAEARLKEARRG